MQLKDCVDFSLLTTKLVKLDDEFDLIKIGIHVSTTVVTYKERHLYSSLQQLCHHTHVIVLLTWTSAPQLWFNQ